MAKLLLNLRDVPDDERDDVRDLLKSNDIRFHETPPSRWGFSAGGIWVSEDAQFPQARRLMDDYQQARARRAREAWQEARHEGRAPTFMHLLREDPLRVLMVLLGIAFLLGLTALPFLLLRA